MFTTHSINAIIHHVSINQSINQLVKSVRGGRSVNKSFTSFNQPINQSFIHSINQSINQARVKQSAMSVSQSVNKSPLIQSTYQSFIHSIQSINHINQASKQTSKQARASFPPFQSINHHSFNQRRVVESLCIQSIN